MASAHPYGTGNNNYYANLTHQHIETETTFTPTNIVNTVIQGAKCRCNEQLIFCAIILMCAYQNSKPNDFLPLMLFNVKWRFKLISKFVIYFVTSNHRLLSILAPHPDSREILGNSTSTDHKYPSIQTYKS